MKYVTAFLIGVILVLSWEIANAHHYYQLRISDKDTQQMLFVAYFDTFEDCRMARRLIVSITPEHTVTCSMEGTAL